MINYEEFKDNAIQDIKDTLTDRGLTVEADVRHVDKLNDGYDAVTIRPENSSIGVNVNLNQLYEAYSNGHEYDDCIEHAADLAENGLKNAPAYDVDKLNDYSQMKDKLSMEVVSSERNAEMLANVPHEDMEDMSVVYRFVLGGSDKDGISSILITNELLDQYGVTPEQLHKDALENAPELRPAVIKGMTEVMVEMMGKDQAEMMGFTSVPKDEPMFVATTPDKVQGAGVLAYQDFMDQAAERLGGDFFVLPSSIHEVLLVKDDGNFGRKELENMVKEVNATQVAPEDKLTDSVYHYDSKAHVFELAEKFESREKEADIDSVDKGSVLADLKAKKDEIAKKPKKDAINKGAKTKGDVAL